MSNVFDHGHGGGGGEQGQQGDTLWCYFHPRELLVGVCAHCLRERLLLLLLASKQGGGGGGGRARVPADGASYLSARPYCRAPRRRTGSIASVFALGSSLLHRLDSSSSRHHAHDVVVHGDDVKSRRFHDVKDDDDDVYKVDPDGEDDASIASLDDSFISIKFEDNGKATWVDAQNVQKAAAKPVADEAPEVGTALRPSATTTAVVEHVKRGGVGATRWRKQVVGRLLQLARWKRAATGGAKQSASSSAAGCHAAEQQRTKGRGRGWIRGLTRRRAAHGDRAWS